MSGRPERAVSAARRGPARVRAARRVPCRRAPAAEFGPAAGVLEHDVFHDVDVRRARVQARRVIERLAAVLEEHVAVLHADFLERLEAVRRESRAHDRDALRARLRVVLQHHVDVRLQPFLAAEPRLESERPFVLGQAEPLRDAAGRAETEAVVRIAGEEIALRDRVEREQQVLATVRLPVRRDAVRHGAQVRLALPVLVDETQLGHPAPLATVRA